ncbi:hydrolase TatD [Streptomyces bobili]|uniref:TatD family hydrolase n=1 Tax=Streptomyces bobili TaxID=67280 RepID=UPI0034400BCC
MRTFDPSIHMTSRTTDDYEAMYAAGVRAVVEPSFWLGQPRTSPASDSMTPAEDTALAAQLQLAAAHGLPALVHTPHRDKLAGLRRTLDVVRESALPEDHVLIDHLNETTVKEAKDRGCWLGLSVHPDTKIDEERMVTILRAYGPEQVLVNSAADWGRSDPLGTRRVGDLMLAEGFTEDEVDRGPWCNPVAAYGLSGRLNLDVAATDATHEGNSILRGEA